MLQEFKISVLLLVIMTLLTGGAYPAIVTLMAQVVFPDAANGSLIRQADAPPNSRVKVDAKVIHPDRQHREAVSSHESAAGSALIGQHFTLPQYFWGRLSATAPVPFNAAASSGSNLGPMNPALLTNAQGRIDQLRAADAELKSIPVDLVTSSASGLDPHISPAAAEFQVPRVAKARQMSETDVRTRVQRHTTGRQFGILGEPVVNVLQLNLDLNRIPSK